MPAGTPDALVMRLNRELVSVMQMPDLKSRLTNEASLPIGSTPDEFGTYFRSEVEKWKKSIKFSGARSH